MRVAQNPQVGGLGFRVQGLSERSADSAPLSLLSLLHPSLPARFLALILPPPLPLFLALSACERAGPQDSALVARGPWQGEAASAGQVGAALIAVRSDARLPDTTCCSAALFGYCKC